MMNFPTCSISEYDWLQSNSCNGITDLQITLAFHILTKRTDENRAIEAYKWLFLANLLGNEKASDLVVFLRLSMTEMQVSEADRLVEEWLETKTNEFLEDNNEDWSEELRNLFKDTTKKQMLI